MRAARGLPQVFVRHVRFMQQFLFLPIPMQKKHEMCKMRKQKCWEPLKFPTKIQV